MIEVDLTWKGKSSLFVVPGVSLKNDPIVARVSRVVGGGLLLKSDDFEFKKAPIELTLIGNSYKIKGLEGSYSF